MPAANTLIESKIDAFLAQAQATQTEATRAGLRVRFSEEDRLAQLAATEAAANMARAAFLGRAQAVYPQACTRYKAAVDELRAARVNLQALDTILNRNCFSTHNLGIELRHQFAAPDEGDIHPAYGAAVDSVRKTLGG
jgi:hypothetical protein